MQGAEERPPARLGQEGNAADRALMVDQGKPAYSISLSIRRASCPLG
jgi:hypothetical protein